jgi:hypothetical protein
MAPRKADLVIIDPQNDFMDIIAGTGDPSGWLLPSGEKFRSTLPVPGAHSDMERVAGLIKRVGNRLNDIHVTLDSHRVIDVAHPGFWRDSRRQAAGAVHHDLERRHPVRNVGAAQPSLSPADARLHRHSGVRRQVRADDLAGALPDRKLGPQRRRRSARRAQRLGADELRHDRFRHEGREHLHGALRRADGRGAGSC